MIDAGRVAAQMAVVRARIAELSDRPVRVVAVTKTFGADAVVAALDAGADGIGENYAQELIAKAAGDVLRDRAVAWHFIGQLQRNKVRIVASHVVLWHTVDRYEVGAEIATRAPGARVLVQVNTTGEGQKAGCAPGETATLVAALQARGLVVAGLMTMGADGDPRRTRAAFHLLRTVADDAGLEECSMGMSADYELALEEGATIIRLGSTLFGPRLAAVK